MQQKTLISCSGLFFLNFGRYALGPPGIRFHILYVSDCICTRKGMKELFLCVMFAPLFRRLKLTPKARFCSGCNTIRAFATKKRFSIHKVIRNVSIWKPCRFFRQTPCEKQPYLVPELLLVFVVSLLSLVWILPSWFRLLVWTVKQLQRCPCPTPSYAQLGLEMKLKTP